MEDLDALLLGAPITLTREDVESQSGVPSELALDIWSAMGFAEIPHGEVAFTERDVEALRTGVELLELGVIDVDSLLIMARAMGQGMSRLAEAQVDVLRQLSGDLELDEAIGAIADTAGDVLPRLDQLVLFVWRRQFAAAVERTLVAARQDGMPLLAVAFLDLVGFTKSTRTWDAGQLERTLERFERDTSLRVASVGGRVVKTLGDGVLFTTDSAASAVQIALDTAAAHEADADLPSVRGGVALGPVLVRLGDVFGEPVNLASRLSEEARPGSVVVDKHAAAELEGFDVLQLSRRSVRGYRSLTPYLVRPKP
ncbi:MAG: adenylate/guanylate cyclase [Frankiales bacterium]|nr:adenylate/guanylate cyclase [Frankiales bacterium]